MESFVREGPSFEETKSGKSLIGKRVLSKSGDVIGRVVQLRINPDKRTLEGVVVRRLAKKIYLCMSYVTRITEEALMLGIDPVVLFKGRAVVTSDGKKFGVVYDLERIQQTNEITHVHLRRHLYKKLSIPKEDFTRFGTSLILKKTYDQARKEYTS